MHGFHFLSPFLKGAGLFCTEPTVHPAVPGSRHHLRLRGYPEGTWWDPGGPLPPETDGNSLGKEKSPLTEANKMVTFEGKWDGSRTVP